MQLSWSSCGPEMDETLKWHSCKNILQNKCVSLLANIRGSVKVELVHVQCTAGLITVVADGHNRRLMSTSDNPDVHRCTKQPISCVAALGVRPEQ